MAPLLPPNTQRRLRAARGLLSVAFAAAVSLSTVVARADEPVRQVTEVRVQAAGEATEVVVTCSATPRYSARLDAGKRLLVDISDAEVKGAAPALTDHVGVVGGVMTQSFKDGASSTTRVAVTLLEKGSYRVRVEGNTLHIIVSKEGAKETTATPPTPAPATPTPAANAPVTTPTESSSRPTVTDVKFTHRGSQDRVVLVGGAKATYAQSTTKAGVTRLELRGASLVDEAQRTLDVSAFNGSVRSVSTFRSSANGGSVVIEATHGEDTTADVSTEGGTLVWTFTRKAASTTSSAPPALDPRRPGIASDGGAARRTRTVSRETEITGIPRVETGIREEQGDSSDAAPFVSGPLGQQKRFGGARVNIDLKDADIHNVLRILADVGKVNIITSDSVKGDVTLRLTNVPWDQALDVVLQAKGLGMTRQGNLVRVAPLADLEKEREMAIQRRKQELELAPVETRLIPVSYSNAADVQARAKELLSARGSIAVDERTNMLIARDVAGNLNQIEELVRSLDTQTPQVLVEARIVEATSRYLRDVGIQWGGDATFSPATGNPTGLAFPSSVGVVGGASDTNTPTAGLSPFQRNVQNPNFAVNLPAATGTGQGGALGLTFGSINNVFNLAVRLSAAESSGMLRIVSSPRILTLDNREARIAQGTLIPFSQLTAQGVQTNFQEAKLQLIVKPHVTADGSVSMHVRINRDEPDFNQTSARGDPTILKREAETDLLVMDGHTAVIGGIFTRNTGRNLDQVPFFGDIPLLGILFQRRRASDSRGELVIFLTPRIVNRAEALGR